MANIRRSNVSSHDQEEEEMTHERVVTIPELILIASTRTAIGAGLGLLIASRLSQEQRKAAGWALLVAGTAISIPIGIEIMGKKSAGTTEGVNLRQAA